jgi:hypothetical protein
MERTMKTLRFSEALLQEMRPWMNKSNLNFTSFVMEAVKNYIRVLKYREGVTKSFGAWKDHEHPGLKNGTTQYVRKMRKGRIHGTF